VGDLFTFIRAERAEGDNEIVVRVPVDVALALPNERVEKALAAVLAAACDWKPPGAWESPVFDKWLVE